MSLCWSSFNNRDNLISDIQSQIIEYSNSIYKRVFDENNNMKRDIKLRGRFKRIDIDSNIAAEVIISFFNSAYKNKSKYIIIQPTMIEFGDNDKIKSNLTLTPIVINIDSKDEVMLFEKTLDTLTSTIYKVLSVEDYEEYINEEWNLLIPASVRIDPSKYLIYESKDAKILNIENNDELGGKIFKEWLKRKYDKVDIYFYKNDYNLFDDAACVPYAFIQINTLFIENFDVRIVAVGDSLNNQMITIPQWNKELGNYIDQVSNDIFDCIKDLYGDENIKIKVFMFEKFKEVNLNE